ncbi:ABC transporter substrate-binding protein [Butyrivibrio sp. VCD2006]|uniref:ABC transporter substrate-binding protein n=1 Tax=Butyrivibrio sp. VCD2006 TaxID=1280664 RepID=UPI00040616D8|nr:sugar ABC transporter substrate-binding protein [Butyrivibrio sp. VCD2006]
MISGFKNSLVKRVFSCCAIAAVALSFGCGNTSVSQVSETDEKPNVNMVEEALSNVGNPTDLVAEEGATIEITYWDGSPADAQAWDTILNKLESDHPEIQIVRQMYPATEYRDIMDSRINNGDWPDVIRYQYQYLGRFKSQDVMLDLTPYLSKNDLMDINEGFLASGLYNGQIVALPHHTDVIAMFYNKRMFENSGIRIPKNIADAYSWDELKDIARKVKQDNKLQYAGTGIWLNNLGYRYLPFVYMNGGSLLDESQTNITVDTKQFREAVQFYKDMRDENLFSESGFTGPQEANNLFVSEEVAFDFAGSWHCSFMQEKMPDNWGVTYMPQKDGKTGTDMGGNSIFCYKNTKYPKAAAIVASYITSKDVMKTFCETGNFIPVRNSLLNMSLTYENFNDEMQLFYEVAKTLDPKMAADETSEHFTDLNIIFGNNMDKIVFDKSATVDAVIKNCKKEMQAALKNQ